MSINNISLVLDNKIKSRYLSSLKTYPLNSSSKRKNIIEFTPFSVFSVQLPEDILPSNNQVHFKFALEKLNEAFQKTPSLIKSNIEQINYEFKTIDELYFTCLRQDIDVLESLMILAKNDGNKDLEKKMFYDLKTLTRKITYKETKKGLPIKSFELQETVEKQLHDIEYMPKRNKGRVFGFQWHHSHKFGYIELIPKFLHESFNHVGWRAFSV